MGGATLRKGGRAAARRRSMPQPWVARAAASSRTTMAQAWRLRVRDFTTGGILHLFQLDLGDDLAHTDAAMVEQSRPVEILQLAELGAGERAELPQQVEHDAVAATLAPVGDLERDPQRHRPAHRDRIEPLGPLLAHHPPAGRT